MSDADFRAIDRKLRELGDSVARRVVRAAVGSGQTVVAKEIRRAVDSEPISRELKRPLKKLVGKRYKRSKRSDAAFAKVGFGVGAARKKDSAETVGRSGKNKSEKSVGVSSANVHWFAAGTRKRTTKTSRANRGALTGVKVVARAYAASKSAASAAMKKKAIERIEAEIAKLRAKR